MRAGWPLCAALAAIGATALAMPAHPAATGWSRLPAPPPGAILGPDVRVIASSPALGGEARSLALSVRGCSMPVGALLLPAHLVLDGASLRWEGAWSRAAYAYGGHVLAEPLAAPGIAALQLAYKGAGALGLLVPSPARGIVVKLFVPGACPDLAGPGAAALARAVLGP